jgi:Arc/MetJ-type ribon-helix-helix transcriptional regulator
MNVSLSKPDLVQFVREQVDHGHFDSVEAVVEAALHLLKQGDAAEELDAAALASVKKSRDGFERGEGRDFRKALGQLRKKYETR